MRSRGAHKLTAAEQFHLLRSSALCRGEGRVRAGRLEWRFEARPTPLSRLYTLDLTYQQGKSPKVTVVRPDLPSLAGGRTIPHLYRQRPPRLCLYLPRLREWVADMRIDQTIVPWSLLWLFYFEEWLVSDEWKGGGEHPDVGDDRD